jgi:polyvinyl alcohol dehydrogenase (cytochrome)
MTRRRIAIALVAAWVTMFAGAAMAASGRGSSAPARRSDWPVYGHDLANTRLAVRERRITRRSVARLTPSWTKNGLVGVSGTPIVSGHVALFGDWKGTIRALEAATGEEIWHTQIGGMVVGAPAIDGDAVYASSGATLYRLDRNTGAVQWKVVTNEHPLAQINASPVVVDGLVLQGVASFEVTIPKSQYTFRGTIGAYDAETGREVWRLYTTPNDSTGGAGVGIWSTPAVDRKRGLLYVGSGNTYAEPTLFSGPGPGGVISFRLGR